MILIIILVLIIVIVYIILNNPCKNEEQYNRGFPPIVTNFYQTYYKAVTPLKPLISPLKHFQKDLELPDIYIYNPKYFSPVRDQGRCGGCWAFALASIMSDNVTIKILKFGKNLNVQQLLSCYPDVNPCDGEAPEDALIWLGKTKFKVSIDNKYLQILSKCVITDTGITVDKNSIKSLCKYIPRESIKNPTPEEDRLLQENIYNMKAQLIKNGSFFGSIIAYQDFFNFKGDKVYTHEYRQKIGGHAITIIGWVNKNVDVRDGFTDGYWVCKNSWGTNWASGYDFPGHFAIKMGSNECGVESRSGCAETDVEYLLHNKEIPEYFVYNNYLELIKHIIKSKVF